MLPYRTSVDEVLGLLVWGQCSYDSFMHNVGDISGHVS